MNMNQEEAKAQMKFYALELEGYARQLAVHAEAGEAVEVSRLARLIGRAQALMEEAAFAVRRLEARAAAGVDEWLAIAPEAKPRLSITKSRAGHYTATLRLGSRRIFKDGMHCTAARARRAAREQLELLGLASGE